MGIENGLMLLGGLALFLYGMQMMSDNLEAIAGNRMKNILEKLTANRFLGVTVGAVITAIIQSSSATTVMVVGFVNSSLMTLKQAVWIIMGANIGTTITGQLIALDVGVIAPLFAFVGVVLIIFVKNKTVEFAGGIVAGLGILFIGMNMMGDAMTPLQNSTEFINIMTKFSNPVFGILAGAGFTAIIQSSSASVGILQALAIGGLIPLESAVFVLFGQNIGTCITAILASIGTNRNAKRTTIIHLSFNVIGTVIFLIISLTTPFVSIMRAYTPTNPAAQIANVHTVFNIVTTIILLPFGEMLAKLSTIILPDKKGEVEDNEDKWLEDLMTSNHLLGVTTLAIHLISTEIKKMYDLVNDNTLSSFELFTRYDISKMEKIQTQELEIDRLNMQIAKKISKVLTVEQGFHEISVLNQLFKLIGNLERIGDHSMNIAECAEAIDQKKLSLSKDAFLEIAEMKSHCVEGLSIFKTHFDNKDEVLKQAGLIEQKIDDMTACYRTNQIERMNKKSCYIESAIYYADLLTDYERIGDHILNLAETYVAIDGLNIEPFTETTNA